MNYYKQTNLPKEHNLWPTSTIAGGESPYIAFNTANTSLHKVCKFKFKNTLIDIKLPCYKTLQLAYMTIEQSLSHGLKNNKITNTSTDRSSSFSVDVFPCPLKSIATTRAFSLILLDESANESLAKEITQSIFTRTPNSIF
jgi:hypothetical protein